MKHQLLLHRRNRLRGITALTLALCGTPCIAETISANPANPSARDAITLTIAGTLPPSDPYAFAFLFNGAVVSGSHIRVDVCVADSIITLPPGYTLLVNVGRLPPGTYVVESFHAFCDPIGPTQLTTPLLATTAALVVSAAPDAIPATSNIGLAVLAALVLLVTAHQFKRRAA